VASLGSFTRSAAQATSSAYRRLPIRWRLAGGSAALTLVILCGFAVIVGVLTTRRIHQDFDAQVAEAADDLSQRIKLQIVETRRGQRIRCVATTCPNLTDYAGSNAEVRVVLPGGDKILASEDAPFLGTPLDRTTVYKGYRVEARQLLMRPSDELRGQAICCAWVQYARKLSDVDETAARVRFFLALGVLGGAALALLAGLTTARRAMSPIAELTEAARAIARTRDPSVTLPRPFADDEVAELSRTLEEMLRSLDAARSETESALGRQREFVADASHELRTPLTSVLANLELLAEELEGEQRETADSALRSTRRMRRLVADLLLLARADAGREAPRRPVDLSGVLVEAAAELEPVSGEHSIEVDAEPGALVAGARDELHRLVLNLLENAVKHTDPGTPVRARVRRVGEDVVLVVEDEGPGVPPELAERIFERFVRGASDRGGSSGLGLAIVRAVAESHGGRVSLESGPAGRGARFVVRIPTAQAAQTATSPAAAI
jgi:signal transduction histidine kinase